MKTQIRFQNMADKSKYWLTPKNTLATLVATALGSGFMPKAPGTAGSIVALPLVWWSVNQTPGVQGLVWIFVLAIGTWASRVLGEFTGEADNQKIVIDEVLGMGLSTLFLSRTQVFHSALWILIAFGFFRFFDALKFPPARQMDRWSKHQKSHWATGFGVMADDLIAGIQTLIVVQVLVWIFHESI